MHKITVKACNTTINKNHTIITMTTMTATNKKNNKKLCNAKDLK